MGACSLEGLLFSKRKKVLPKKGLAMGRGGRGVKAARTINAMRRRGGGGWLLGGEI